MRYVYPAIFTPVENGRFDVKVPDLPGCRTCGDDLPYGGGCRFHVALGCGER